MIRQTWRCRYCPCLSYTSELSVIHELHECYKNPRNLIKTESYFNLIEHVTTKVDDIKLSETIGKLPDDEDLRILTYRTLLEKFNQKYLHLNKPQKSLLKSYINNISNTNSLKETLQELVKGLKKILNYILKILLIKLLK